MVGAYEGQRVTLECESEAYPKSINYWTREKGEIVPTGMFTLVCNEHVLCYEYLNSLRTTGAQFEPVLVETAYKVIMRLDIRSVGPADFGRYRCVAKNSLGESDDNIKLYSTYKCVECCRFFLQLLVVVCMRYFVLTNMLIVSIVYGNHVICKKILKAHILTLLAISTGCEKLTCVDRGEKIAPD